MKLTQPLLCFYFCSYSLCISSLSTSNKTLSSNTVLFSRASLKTMQPRLKHALKCEDDEKSNWKSTLALNFLFVAYRSVRKYLIYICEPLHVYCTFTPEFLHSNEGYRACKLVIAPLISNSHDSRIKSFSGELSRKYADEIVLCYKWFSSDWREIFFLL